MVRIISVGFGAWVIKKILNPESEEEKRRNERLRSEIAAARSREKKEEALKKYGEEFIKEYEEKKQKGEVGGK